MAEKGKLLVFSGPSGSGKDSILDGYLKSSPENVWKSVSCTTRLPRAGEEHGKDYYFVSKDVFFEMIDNHQMLEYADFGGNYYGTPKTAVDEHLLKGNIVILKIEVQGFQQIKRLYPDCVSIFVLPPSKEILEKRIKSRASETDEDIIKRLKIAESEMALSSNYDYTIINDDLQNAVNELSKLIKNI